MEICEVENCQKQANLGGLCQLHRRKDIAGGLEYDEGLIWDTCAAGHRWTEANTHYENNGNGGKRRRCKQCLADKAERRRQQERQIATPAPVRLENAEHQQAFATFDMATNEIDAKCKDDYARFTDYTAENAPSDVEAAKMCAGCPLMVPCANAAIATRPGWGVHAGNVWYDGSILETQADREKMRIAEAEE